MNVISALFDKRVRGIRLIELIGLSLALAMIFWVCLSKAREGEDIRRMNQLDEQIADEKAAVGGLQVEVAKLERPERLEALATEYLGMKPVSPTHEAGLENLSEISRTTSRPVVGATAALAAPVAETPDDTLISTDGAQTAASQTAAAKTAPVALQAVRPTQPGGH